MVYFLLWYLFFYKLTVIDFKKSVGKKSRYSGVLRGYEGYMSSEKPGYSGVILPGSDTNTEQTCPD